MYSNEEAGLTLQCGPNVRPTHEGYLHTTYKPPGDEKFCNIFKEKSDNSTRFNKISTLRSDNAESTQLWKKQDDPPDGEKDRHCRDSNQTSLSGRVLRNRRSR